MYKFLNKRPINIVTPNDMKALEQIIAAKEDEGSCFSEEGTFMVYAYYAGLLTVENMNQVQMGRCMVSNAKNGFIQVTMIVRQNNGQIVNGALMYVSAASAYNAMTTYRHASVRAAGILAKAKK